MRTALAALLLCAAVDLAACVVLLGAVWVEHRRVRREAHAAGEPLPSVRGQLGCLLLFAVIGLVTVYGTAWLLLCE